MRSRVVARRAGVAAVPTAGMLALALSVALPAGIIPDALALVATVSAQAASDRGYVVIWPGSKEYHWPSCPLIKQAKGVAVLMRAQAVGKGYKPHKDCDPSQQSAGVGQPTGPVYVSVAKSDPSRYHRGDCKQLPKDAKRVLLDKEAVRGRWPCTVCRPPIRAATVPPPSR